MYISPNDKYPNNEEFSIYLNVNILQFTQDNLPELFKYGNDECRITVIAYTGINVILSLYMPTHTF